MDTSQVSALDRELRHEFARALPVNFHSRVDAMINQFDVPIPLKTKAAQGGEEFA